MIKKYIEEKLFKAELTKEKVELARKPQSILNEAKKLDSACLNIAKALLARCGNVIRNTQNASIKDFSPQQLDSMASAALKTQKFAKLALGESTDNINLNGNLQENETFARAMELLDSVEDSRSTGNSTTH